MSEAVDILVITAHPDDAEFGVAGTVARWTREGKQVVYVVCTSGDKGTSDRSMRPEKLAEIRKKEQKAAAKVLGVYARVPQRASSDDQDLSAEDCCDL